MSLIDTPMSKSFITSGEDQHHYRQNSSAARGAQGTTVPSTWHGGNSSVTSSEHANPVTNGPRWFPFLRRVPRVEPQPWTSFRQPLVFGRWPDHRAANRPTG